MYTQSGFLSKTVSLSPLSAVDAAYEALIMSSQTTAGDFSQELFKRGDSDEPLVKIADYGIAGTCYYALADGRNAPYGKVLAGAISTVYVRRSLAERLQQANSLLQPFGYELFVHDGWRHPLTQAAIFTTYVRLYKASHPQASDADARAYTLKFASDPSFSQADPTTVPLHASGGAVDVTLLPKGGSTPLHLGTPYDDITPRAYTAYFEYNQPRNDDEVQDQLLRRLLNAAMLLVGFTNYPQEWWHFDFGNRMYGAYCDALQRSAPPDVPGYAYIEPRSLLDS